jgi:hypothetical protein
LHSDTTKITFSHLQIMITYFCLIKSYNEIGNEGASKLGSSISNLKDLSSLSLNFKY